MNSPSVLNYEIRPCKFVERRMLLASFARIMGVFKQKYQYIGFGGLSFTDFKLFHRELHIDEMCSIEGGDYSYEKLEFNKPYSCINIRKGHSSEVLSNLNMSLPSIIWLDYDDHLSETIFNDLLIVLQAVPVGSIYIMSCNRQLQKEKGIPYTNDEFREEFGGLVPYDIEENCCVDSKASNTIRRMIEMQCQKVIRDRNRLLEEKISYKTLYNIQYGNSRNREAKMYTCGGIILREGDDINLNLTDLPFISTEKPYEIDLPNLTYRETSHLNQILNVEDKEDELIHKEIVSKIDLEKFKEVYRYMPNFYDVRL